MSTTAVDGNYAIILPVLKQGREGNRKENKRKNKKKDYCKDFCVRKRKKNILFYKCYKGFCSNVFSVIND